MTVTIPQNITATRLRYILLGALSLTIILGSALFYLGYSQLSGTATETGEQVASARESETTIQRLESLKTELEEKKELVFTASQVTADSQNYAYQDRLVNDLTVYANRANLAITNISFTNPASSASTPASSSLEGANTAPTSSASLQTATVDITLESPLNYRDLLNFLHYIEQNLTKLKVSRVTMTKNQSENVTIDVLNLEVYLQ